MSRLTIDTGTAGNAATGDSLRTAFTKVNTNFTELYAELGGDSLDAISFTNNTISTDITNANLILTGNGTGGVIIEDIEITGSTVNVLTTNNNLTLNTNGTGKVVINGLSFPTTDGTAGQVLKTDGAGNLSFTAVDAGAITFVGDDSTGTAVNTGETFKIAGSGTVTTSVSGDTITITGSASAQGITFVGDDSTGTRVSDGESFKIAGSGTVTTSVSGDTITITGSASAQGITFVGDDSTGTRVSDGESFKIAGGTGLTSVVSGDTITLDIDSTVATLTGSQELTNKTLTTPKIDLIKDANGNEVLVFSTTASATDYLVIKNGIGVGSPLHIYADGDSANIGVHLQPKGSGIFTISDGTDFNKGIRFRSSSSAASTITLIDAVSTAGRVVTLPDATDTLVGRATEDTLTNKSISLTTNTITGTVITMVGDDSTGTAINIGETFKIAGTQNITTSVSGDTLTITGPNLSSYLTNSTITVVGDDSTGTTLNSNETIKVAGTQNITTAVSGDTLTITGPDLSSYLTAVPKTIDVNEISSGDSSAIQINDAINVSGAGTFHGSVRFNAGYTEKINALTSSSTITVNCATASIHTVTLAVSTGFVISNLPTGGTVTLIITQGGSGSYTATFGTDTSTTVKFPGGAPTLSTAVSSIDVVTIFNDGTNYLGNIAKAYAA
jgi:hypothetical protein